MATRKKDYDEECYVLARHFLADHPNADQGDSVDLACAIQEAVEDWLTEFEEKKPKP